MKGELNKFVTFSRVSSRTLKCARTQVSERGIDRLVGTAIGSTLKEYVWPVAYASFCCLALNFYHREARIIYFFTRRTRVFELYVRSLVVACGFPIAPIHYALLFLSEKKVSGHVPFIASCAVR